MTLRFNVNIKKLNKSGKRKLGKTRKNFSAKTKKFNRGCLKFAKESKESLTESKGLELQHSVQPVNFNNCNSNNQRTILM